MRGAVALLALVACTTAQPEVRPDPPAAPSKPTPDAPVRQVVTDFLRASEQRDFEAVYALLAAPLRARYTPARLAADFDAEPLAKERLARIARALELELSIAGDRASLALGGDRALRLVHEEAGWRIAALE